MFHAACIPAYGWSCCDLVRSDMLVLRPQMFACQMKVLKCACWWCRQLSRNGTEQNFRNGTELSKHIWHLKQNKTDFTIKWSIIKKSISYTGGSKRCNLCLEEKLNILKEKDNCLLNKRSEIISACQHKNRFQVKSLNKERNACYFNDNTPTFPPWA